VLQLGWFLNEPCKSHRTRLVDVGKVMEMRGNRMDYKSRSLSH